MVNRIKGLYEKATFAKHQSKNWRAGLLDFILSFSLSCNLCSWSYDFRELQNRQHLWCLHALVTCAVFVSLEQAFTLSHYWIKQLYNCWHPAPVTNMFWRPWLSNYLEATSTSQACQESKHCRHGPYGLGTLFTSPSVVLADPLSPWS